MKEFEEVNSLVLELTSDTYAQFKEINRTIEGIEQELNAAFIQEHVDIEKDEIRLRWRPYNLDNAWVYNSEKNTYYPYKTIFTFIVRYVDETGDRSKPLRHAPNSIINEALPLIPLLLKQLRDKCSEIVKVEDE